jgi:hypothetical protein
VNRSDGRRNDSAAEPNDSDAEQNDSVPHLNAADGRQNQPATMKTGEKARFQPCKGLRRVKIG